MHDPQREETFVCASVDTVFHSDLSHAPAAEDQAAAALAIRSTAAADDSSRSWRSQGVLASAVMGFLIGAVFWHFIGFWGFVREVVLRGPAHDRPPVAQTGPTCTAILLDRTGGARGDACPADAAWLAEGPGAGKGDLLIQTRPMAAKRWSVTVQADADAETAD